MQQAVPTNPNNVDTAKYDTFEPESFDPFQDSQEYFWSQPFYDPNSSTFGAFDSQTNEFMPVPDLRERRGEFQELVEVLRLEY